MDRGKVVSYADCPYSDSWNLNGILDWGKLESLERNP